MRGHLRPFIMKYKKEEWEIPFMSPWWCCYCYMYLEKVRCTLHKWNIFYSILSVTLNTMRWNGMKEKESEEIDERKRRAKKYQKCLLRFPYIDKGENNWIPEKKKCIKVEKEGKESTFSIRSIWDRYKNCSPPYFFFFLSSLFLFFCAIDLFTFTSFIHLFFYRSILILSDNVSCVTN